MMMNWLISIINNLPCFSRFFLLILLLHSDFFFSLCLFLKQIHIYKIYVPFFIVCAFKCSRILLYLLVHQEWFIIRYFIILSIIIWLLISVLFFFSFLMFIEKFIELITREQLSSKMMIKIVSITMTVIRAKNDEHFINRKILLQNLEIWFYKNRMSKFLSFKQTKKKFSIISQSTTIMSGNIWF